MDNVKETVEKYKDIYGRINSIWRSPARQEGFRQVLEEEEGYKENPYGGDA